MKYRKKPVVVEAHQWFINGDHPEDRSEMVSANGGAPYMSEGKVVRYLRYFRRPDVSGQFACSICEHKMQIHGWIDTLEGGHIVCPGDWIVKGVKGEFYPCKPDIFEMTYEPVEESKEGAE